METGQAPQCTNHVQSLHALVNKLSPSVLESGAVLLLPRHRCCAGSCRGVESQDNKEMRENIAVPENKDIPESKETPPQGGHILEGIWECGIEETVLVHTVQGKPGYLFGTKLSPSPYVRFWLRIGEDISKTTLEGAAFYLCTGFLSIYFSLAVHRKRFC